MHLSGVLAVMAMQRQTYQAQEDWGHSAKEKCDTSEQRGSPQHSSQASGYVEQW